MNKNRDKTTPFMNLKGAMGFIKKSKYPLAPLYEAITNSLEAISQRDDLDSNDDEPFITVNFYFAGLIDDLTELEKIEVIDNGAGFTPTNDARFREFFDKSKGFDNRGTGRLQFLHRFNTIKIESIYKINNDKYRRSYTCSVDSFIKNDENIVCNSIEKLRTTVSLVDCAFNDKEKSFFDELKIDWIVNDIKRHFLLRFYLDEQNTKLSMPKINVAFMKNGKEANYQSLTFKNMPKPETTGEIEVPYLKVKNPNAQKIEWQETKREVIKWAHFKVQEDELAETEIYLCSKDMPIEALTYKGIKKKDSVDGFRYLTVFYGDVLDKPENVSDTLDCFKFPDKQKTEISVNDLFFNENEEFLFFDDIKEQIDNVIPFIYENVFNLLEKQKKNIEEIAKAHGIPIDVALKAKINLNDDEEQITKKIYIEQSTGLAKKGFVAKKLHESLNELNPTSDNYQKELEKKVIALSDLIEQQNKEELSRYIIRREMVANVLKKILARELEYQIQPIGKGKRKDKEGLIHDLILKRKSTDTSVLNDLWILNEEFLHFDGCSDLPLDQIKMPNGENLLKNISNDEMAELGVKPKKRPDIFLFPDEGKCVLIEFKEPTEDLSDHLQQLPKYCMLIANYSSQKFDKFYCYLIGENINPHIDLNEYDETVTGDWVRSNIPIRSVKTRESLAILQLEVIKLSSLYDRAHRRNKSFAEKLGLPALLN